MAVTAILVDDDASVARLLAGLLHRLDYTVHVAHDTATALALLRAHAVDIGILDVDLGDGATTAPIALELFARRVPILFLTGLEEPALPPLPASAAVAFLTKPVTLTAMRTTLGLLRKHAAALDELATTQFLLGESQRLASVGSFQLDYTTGAIVWTDETYRMFGVTRDTFTPTTESLLTLVHPDDRAAVAAAMVPVELPPGTYHIEYRAVRPDGAVRTLRGVVEHAAAGERPRQVIGMIQDITDRERQRSEREAMEQRVEVAHAANRAKTDFLAHMSHELRTPLNAVLGLSEAMIERVFGELNVSQVETLETIYKSGRHLLELINDILDIARVESGKLALDVEQTALRPLLDEVIALVAPTFAERHQTLALELAGAPTLPPVDLDKRRIRQALINLLGNAAKFSPEGARVAVRLDADLARREVSIAVSDRGPGIAPADRERIFQPFVTIDPVHTRRHDGAGLGLALAKQFVELHRGRLELASEVGVGSTFTIVLPVSAAYIAPPVDLHRAVPPRPGSVMLVEDNAGTVLAMRTYLESRGYTVRVVGDGPAALAAAADPDVRLVLMDLRLPGLDGLEVTRRLRARAFAKPIVALTAHAMPEDERRCLEAGATAYLAKPVRLRLLAETIDRLLAEAAA